MWLLSADESRADLAGWAALLLVLLVTAAGAPLLLHARTASDAVSEGGSGEGAVSAWHVWYFGWLTAVSTGLGVIPFFFSERVPKDVYLGVSNALAAGMMISASLGLVWEGMDTAYIPGFFGYQPGWRVLPGFALGVLNIMLTKRVLAKYDDLTVPHMKAQDVRKVILIIFVMTLHSVSEGIGIGVSFGGKSGTQLGQFISLSLGIHNIPEGLAVALVMRSRGFTKLRTIIWCIFTSLPQPIMAVPAYLFIENFEPMLAAGLGFAAGAMVYVAIFELMAEAVEQCGRLRTGAIVAIAFCLMTFSQERMKGSIFDSPDGHGGEF